MARGIARHVKVKALSLKEPWCDLIVQRRKTIETRTWKTNYRGPLVLCASKTIDKEALAHFARLGFFCLDERFPWQGFARTIVNLIDCRPMTRDDEEDAWIAYSPKRYAWILDNPQNDFSVFKVRGQLGLFDIEVPPRFLFAKYCPGPFYMGWWLYERDRMDGSHNNDGDWGWLKNGSWRLRAAYDLCCELGHCDMPEPKDYGSDAFAEEFGRRFPEGIKVCRWLENCKYIPIS